jgi:hypothetical protein
MPELFNSGKEATRLTTHGALSQLELAKKWLDACQETLCPMITLRAAGIADSMLRILIQLRVRSKWIKNWYILFVTDMLGAIYCV